MAKITIEIISLHGIKRDLRVFDKGCVQIGRSYTNDIILQDSYVSPEHLCVRILEGGQLVVEDLDSRNGSFVVSEMRGQRGKVRLSGATEIDSGCDIALGHTVIRVFCFDHPVAPAKVMDRLKSTGFSVNRKVTTWYALVGCFLLYFIDAVLNNVLKDQMLGAILFAEFLGLLVVAIWAGIWALIGRMIRHRSRFRVHLTMACLFIFAIVPIVNICGYLGFVFADARLETISLLTLCSVAFAFLLYGHKTYATQLSVRARIVSSAAIPVVLCFLVGLGYFSFSDRFSPEPPYYSRLKPPLICPVKTHEIDDFEGNLGKLFESARDKQDKSESK